MISDDQHFNFHLRGNRAFKAVRAFAAATIPLIILASAAFAETAAETAEAQPQSAWLGALKYIGENAFTFTLVLLFLTAILSSYLSRRLNDRCLKHNEGFPITLILKDGQVYRGALDAENNGLEVLFDRPRPIGEGPPRKSVLLYQPEYPQLHALVCFQYALNTRQLKRRRKSINRAYHPRFYRKLGRKIRNFFAAIKDAINDAFTLLIGRWKSAGPQAEVLRSQDRYVTSMGTQVISAATQNSFDPLLEKLIGKRVLVEATIPNQPRILIEGILKEYSKDFIEIQDVFHPDSWSETIAPGGDDLESLGLTISWNEGRLEARNPTVVDVKIVVAGGLEAAESGEKRVEPKEMTAPAGGSAAIDLPVSDAALTLNFFATRPSDMILPRHSSIVRSRLEFHRNDHTG